MVGKKQANCFEDITLTQFKSKLNMVKTNRRTSWNNAQK